MPATNTAIFSIVTFGRPARRLPGFVRSLDRAIKFAGEAVHTGTCTETRVYECSTIELAKTADISEVRDGEHRVWQS